MQLLERSLSEEHREIRDRADEFARDVVEPRAEEIEAADEFPRDVIEAAGDMDILGILLPEEYGGLDSDFISYALAVERVARASGAVAETIQGHTFAALPIARHGTESQKEAWLPEMAAGDAVGAMLLTEPGAGSSPTELETVAEEADDGYRLSGEKSFGTNAGVADVHLVVARKQPQPEDSHGVSVFLAPGVDEADGFSFDRAEFMGMRGHVTGDSTLDGVHVDSDALLGSVGEGFRIAMGTIDMARTGLGAIGTGIAQAAYEDAVDYASERRQGGNAIGEYQAVQVLVAKMDTRLDAARHLVYESAATIADEGGNTRKSSQSKYYASDVAEFVTRNAMQIYGGKGYRTDYPLERYFRDAKILSLIGGTTEIQQTTVATESLSL
ncbi:acyl-CoA dehydrogenase family protein [Halomicroarcula limicola]|uniref:Acyl-CoA dehydrogenase family protein n=1 Tax=Haloarcula limicola TaxID=1429915 RepID=A0A8J7YDJ5_9EURY|nr:acyl-CoA dehydrogenase family protein [Halomicroarcula limicola]MBV0925969.1 acyl-CoA dehydrogenase family protein [Halomicroarcula limicola]